MEDKSGRRAFLKYRRIIGMRCFEPPMTFSNSFLKFPCLLGIALLFGLSQCALEEDFLRDPGTQISFSTDTLSFDTVFTELGSTTQSFKIYNPHDRPLSLASVRVESNNGGRFRINVDGISGQEVKDVFVGAQDSIYVFAEVTVDPDADVSVSPFVLEGRVVVRTVDVEQSILLVAFGQNANYLPRNRKRGSFNLLSCDLGTERLDDPKPYVLYGSLIVDSCTLVLPPGCRFYIHGGIVRSEVGGDTLTYNDGLLFLVNRGRLVVEGTAERPVTIASDRLEEFYAQRAGQYSGIRLLAGTGPHKVDHARIRHGSVGIFVDSAARLDISNTELSYITSNGLFGYAATINSDNVSIHSTGAAGFQTLRGGRYTLDHCTVVNLTGRNPAVSLSSTAMLSDESVVYGNLIATVRNSLFYSSSSDALALNDGDRPELLNYTIDNSILRVKEILKFFPTFSERCTDCVFVESTSRLFFNVAKDSFQLDSMSVAIGRGKPIPELPLDLLGAMRDAINPDIGAYEFVPQ